MHKILVTINLKEGTLAATMAAAQPCIEATRREPGCIMYDFYVAEDGRDSYVAVECFRDKEAHAVHEKTPHFLAFLPILQANVESFTIEAVDTTPA